MDTRLCPVTGEPLPVTDPGRIVSQTACNRLRVATSDLAVVRGITMLLVFAVLVINALVDISYVFIDPRLRSRESS